MATSSNGEGKRDIEKTGDDEGLGGEDKSYEVGWINGDQDPDNPRAMSKGRKWVATLVVSASSLCV